MPSKNQKALEGLSKRKGEEKKQTNEKQFRTLYNPVGHSDTTHLILTNTAIFVSTLKLCNRFAIRKAGFIVLINGPAGIRLVVMAATNRWVIIGCR